MDIDIDCLDLSQCQNLLNTVNKRYYANLDQYVAAVLVAQDEYDIAKLRLLRNRLIARVALLKTEVDKRTNDG